MAVIRRWFDLTPGGEWTVEANPGTLDEAKVEILAAAGVNRVSLGARSFQPDLLKALERNHAPEEVARAVDLVRPRFPRWSLDLIFGVPGSTLRDCEADLDTALALGPSHLSCYGLVYEKGTNLWKQWQAGQVVPVDEDVEREMYEAVIDRLEGAGLGDVRDLELRPARRGIAAQPGLLGERGILRGGSISWTARPGTPPSTSTSRSPRRRRSSASSPSPPSAAGGSCACCPRPAPATTATTSPRPPTAPSSRC